MTYNVKTPKAGKKEKSKKTEPKPAPKPADEEQLPFGDFGTEEAAGRNWTNEPAATRPMLR